MAWHDGRTMRGRTEGGWAWLMVTLAGVFPFVADMLRNFQLFTPEQLAWSFATIMAATGAVFALAGSILRGIEAALRRAGRGPVARLVRIAYALAAAAVFALFLYDSNMTELRQHFGLSRLAAASVVVLLFAMYWALAAWLGAKRTCILLAAALAFRLAQANLAISDATARGDALVSAEEIRIYQKVKLARTPNIYFICLESYHGFDAMKELYGFDNAPFREFLGQNEFAVAEQTLANYWYTISSLQSFLQMGHHYAAGNFGNHDSLYARGFISGSGTYYNPVLNILKQNGYSIVYLLPSDYYYRPGAGLVDMSLLDRSWPLAPLKVSLPRFIGREPDTDVVDFDRKVSETIAEWPQKRPAFFFTKMGAEHASQRYDYRTDREGFVARYVESVGEANPRIEALCRQIIERDPQGIVILAGDHGAQSYKGHPRGYRGAIREEDLPAERMVRDVHEVLLAIRWGGEGGAVRYPFRSLANVMRFVFYRLSGDEALRGTAVSDSSYLLDGDGLFYQTSDEGRPLSEWKPVPRSSPVD